MDPGFYPIDNNLANDAKNVEGAVFLVDIGGGKGHDLQELHRKYPKLPGKLVLQDLKSVIDEAKSSGLNQEIVTMEHDFFTPQPIKGNSHKCSVIPPANKVQAHEPITCAQSSTTGPIPKPKRSS